MKYKCRFFKDPDKNPDKPPITSNITAPNPRRAAAQMGSQNGIKRRTELAHIFSPFEHQMRFAFIDNKMNILSIVIVESADPKNRILTL